MSSGVGHRRGLDLVLLWLWCRLVVVAPIGPLAWEPPYAEGETPPQKKQTNLEADLTRFSVPALVV